MWLLFQNVICNADHCDQRLKSKIEGEETVDSGLVSDCVVLGSTAVVTGTTANSFFSGNVRVPQHSHFGCGQHCGCRSDWRFEMQKKEDLFFSAGIITTYPVSPHSVSVAFPIPFHRISEVDGRFKPFSVGGGIGVRQRPVAL